MKTERFFGCFWMGLLSALLITACGESEFVPLSPAIMEAVLYDIHVADAIAEHHQVKPNRRVALREDMYEEVLIHHQLSREEFFQSYKYYLDETIMLDSMYNRIIERLQENLEGVEFLKGEENEADQSPNPPPDPERLDIRKIEKKEAAATRKE